MVSSGQPVPSSVSSFFVSQLDYIFFVYGLAFILLAATCFSLWRSARPRLPWQWLCVFGFLHGLHEWLDVVAIAHFDNRGFTLARGILLWVSYLPLIEFGRSGVRLSGKRQPGRIVIFLAAAAVSAGLLLLTAEGMVVARYAIGFPGALWSAAAIYLAAKRSEADKKWLLLAAAGFAGYASLTAAGVSQANFFPASIINQQAFFSTFGFPIQLLRAIAACVISLGIWQHQQALFRDALSPSRRSGSRISDLACLCSLLLVLAGGWAGANGFSAARDAEERQDLLAVSRAIALSISDEDLKQLQHGGAVAEPAFKRLQRQLNRFRFHGGRQVRLNIVTKNREGFAVLNPAVPYLLRLGDRAAYPAQEAQAVIAAIYEFDADATAGPYEAGLAGYVSAFSAIRDQQGSIAGIVGLDGDAKDWKTLMAHHRLVPLSMTFLIVVIGASFFVARQKSIDATTRIAASEKQYRSMFEDNSAMMLLVDSHTSLIVDANHSALCFYGCSLGKLRRLQLPGINIPLNASASPADAASRDPFKVVHRLAGGELRSVEVFSMPIVFRSLKCVYFIIHDITESERAEAERSKFEMQMQQAHKLESIGILAGGIAHDFNNMLTGLFGHIDLAREYALSAAYHKVAPCLGEAMGCLSRAKGLTQQLLTFAKGGGPAKKTMPVSAVLKDAAAFAFSGSNIEVKFHLQEDLWPCDLDKSQITQAIDNILINAREAMLGGGTVSIRAENVDDGALPLPKLLPPGPYVRVVISDEGPGIAKEHLEHIFDPFFTTKETGHGLGLSIAHSVVKKHLGHIEVESREGAGCEFLIYLPAATECSLVSQVEVERIQRGEGKILVMDDDPAVVSIAAKMITQSGYSVVSAASGEEAVRLYCGSLRTALPFDAVILDLTIRGGMGGRETLKLLKEIDPTVRAIVSSGYSNDPVMSEPAKFGFKAALAKPYRSTDMAGVLHRLLRETNAKPPASPAAAAEEHPLT